MVKYQFCFLVQLRVMNESTLHLGLCLPKSCTNNHIRVLSQELFSSNVTKNKQKLQPNVLQVKDLEFDPKFLLKKSVLFFIAILLAIEFLNRFAVRTEKNEKINDSNKIALGLENKPEKTTFREIVQCFNLMQINKESDSRSVPSVSGLK